MIKSTTRRWKLGKQSVQNYSLIDQLKSNLVSQINSIQYSISKLLLKNLTNIKRLTINNLALQANCSKSAIVKFCKSLNLDGYKQLVQMLIFENSFLHPVVNKKETRLSINQKVYLDQYYQLIQKNFELIKMTQTQKIIWAAELTRKTHRVFLFGKGANLHLLSIFNNYLMKLNYNVFYSEDLDVQEKYANNAFSDDVCYVFSYSGITPPIVEIVKQLQIQKTKIIMVTANLYSPMIQGQEIIIQVLNNEEVLNKQRHSMMSFMFIVMQLIYLLSN